MIQEIVLLLVMFQGQQPHDDNHEYTGFQQPIIPAKSAQEVHHNQGETGSKAVLFLVHKTVSHVACHQQKPNHNKPRNEGGHRIHELRKERSQSATEAYDGEGAHARRVSTGTFGVRLFALHTDDKADTQRSSQLVELVELNHRRPRQKLVTFPYLENRGKVILLVAWELIFADHTPAFTPFREKHVAIHLGNHPCQV